jgi:hypothetical protein
MGKRGPKSNTLTASKFRAFRLSRDKEISWVAEKLGLSPSYIRVVENDESRGGETLKARYISTFKLPKNYFSSDGIFIEQENDEPSNMGFSRPINQDDFAPGSDNVTIALPGGKFTVSGQNLNTSEDVIQAAAYLLQMATRLEPDPKQPRKIFATFDNFSNPLLDDSYILELLHTLGNEKHDWQITTVWQQVDSKEHPNYMKRLARYILGLLDLNSRHSPRITLQSTENQAIDMLIVDGVGVMLLNSTSKNWAGWLYCKSEEELAEKNIKRKTKGQKNEFLDAILKPLQLYSLSLEGSLQTFLDTRSSAGPRDWVAWEQKLARIETEYPGPVYFVKPFISTLTYSQNMLDPESVWTSLLQDFSRNDYPDEGIHWIEELAKARGERIRAFESNCKRHSVRHVALFEEVETWVKEKTRRDGNMPTNKDQDEVILDRLKTMVNYLTSHPKFELAWVRKTDTRMMTRLEWTDEDLKYQYEGHLRFGVKQKLVCVEYKAELAGVPQRMCAQIENDFVGGVFNEFYGYVWNKISEEDRTKERVIDQLNSWISEVEMRLG